MRPSYYVQALLRGIDVLECAVSSPEGVTLAGLAKATGLKQGTAHKLARTLVSRGYLEKTARPVRYRLGPSALALVDRRLDTDVMVEAQEALLRLAEAVPPATATLCEAIGGEVVNLLRIAPERPGFVERPARVAMQPYFTAAALVYQAWWTEEERATYRRRHPFWEYGAHVWSSLEELDAFLESSRERGYVSVNFDAKGVYVTAAPVFGPRGGLRASVGAALPTGEADGGARAKVMETVLAAAAEIAGVGRT